MPKYRVRDRIIIKSLNQLKKMALKEDDVGLEFKYDTFTCLMYGYCGRGFTIRKIVKVSEGEHIYYLKQQIEGYAYYEEWFLPETIAAKILLLK